MDVDSFMSICFCDHPISGSKPTNAAWKKSPSRLLFQAVLSYFKKINNYGGTVVAAFTKKGLSKVMRQCIEEKFVYSNADD